MESLNESYISTTISCEKIKIKKDVGGTQRRKSFLSASSSLTSGSSREAALSSSSALSSSADFHMTIVFLFCFLSILSCISSSSSSPVSTSSSSSSSSSSPNPRLEYLNPTQLPYPNTSCQATPDGISFWPETPASFQASVPCFLELEGILYDTSQNATRMCYWNGTWAAKSDYSRCKPIQKNFENSDILQVLWDVKEALTIYYIGYGLSLIALTIALWIFLYFKDLRCVRNTIHSNLMVTYVLNDLTWIITATLQSHPSPHLQKVSCYSLILLTYFIGTNFFWMFVEGHYLYILVVKTFSIELINIHKYMLVGYGLPALIVAIWAPIKFYYGTGSVSADSHAIASSCKWQPRDSYDYIFVVPMLLVLLVNIFFLGKIMFVLITKLRAATTAESQQYRKAAKALLVLIPLLGVTYLLVIVTPPWGTAKIIFTYLQAALLSTQGFSVAVLYCFLNNEVRQSVRHHFERWKVMRTLRGGDYPPVGLDRQRYRRPRSHR